ncbi:MAG: TraB/GumN family protein [Chitinophagaceae bacterium]|nr:TraB/GumN family protein [Chitinophagaceae bacterium]
MKKRITFCILIAILCSIQLFAEGKNKPLPKTLLWKLSKGTQTAPSYLFGTIHVICEEDYFWTPTMQKCFDQCKQVSFEMDISNNALSAETASMMIDFSGGTLRDYFDNEQDYNIVRSYIEDSLGQNIEIAERIKPVALYLMYNLALAKGPCANTVSYELKLLEQAKSSNKKIQGLESLADQMEVLESIPTDSIIKEMIQIAKGESKDGGEVQKMINAYKKQDLNLLQQMITEADNSSIMDAKVLVDERNKKWIKPSEKAMAEGSTFFAVGAGHVYGLLHLLRDAGYQIEPILK